MAADKEITLEEHLKSIISGDYTARDAVQQHTELAAEAFLAGNSPSDSLHVDFAENAERRRKIVLEDFMAVNIPSNIKERDVEGVIKQFYKSRGYSTTGELFGVLQFSSGREELGVNMTYSEYRHGFMITVQRH